MVHNWLAVHCHKISHCWYPEKKSSKLSCSHIQNILISLPTCMHCPAKIQTCNVCVNHTNGKGSRTALKVKFASCSGCSRTGKVMLGFHRCKAVLKQVSSVWLSERSSLLFSHHLPLSSHPHLILH